MVKIKRNIILIDEEKCDGCASCITSCPEGALKIIATPKGPKARVVKENFCDGLGACIGNCPRGALTIEKKLTEAYDENSVIKHIKKTSPEKLQQHMDHLKKHEREMHHEHGGSLPCGCPGSMATKWESKNKGSKNGKLKLNSELRQWPVQLALINPRADYFRDSDLLIAADCVPFSYAGFHRDFLAGKSIVMGCPKLDDTEMYKTKLIELFKNSNLKSITVVNMEVPCCFGLQELVKESIKESGKKIPYSETIISVKGDIKT